MTSETAPSAASRRAHQKLIIKRITLVLLAIVAVTLLFEGIQGLGVTSAVPSEARNFTAKTLDGKTWTLADRRGKNPVLLCFFATWCGPCMQEFPHLVELKKQHPELEVVMLSREEPEVVKGAEMFQEASFTYIPDAGPVYEQYHVDGIPHAFLFNRAGALVDEVPGYADGALEPLGQKL